jgi:hypothetical protein
MYEAEYTGSHPDAPRLRIAVHAARAWAACPCETHGYAAEIAAEDAYDVHSGASTEAANVIGYASYCVGRCVYAPGTSDYAAHAEWAAMYAAAAVDESDSQEEEMWQAHRLVALLWPHLSEAEHEVAAALLPDWEHSLDDLHSAVTVALAQAA